MTKKKRIIGLAVLLVLAAAIGGMALAGVLPLAAA